MADLTRARTCKEILGTFDAHGKSFDAINYVTAVHRLARQSSVSDPLWLREDPVLRRLMQQLKHRLAANDADSKRGFRVGQIVQLIWAIAKLRLGRGHHPVLHAACVVLEQQPDESFSPKDLAMLTWALAKAGLHDKALFGRIADIAVPRLHEFSPQDLSNTLWALATTRHSHPTLFLSAGRVIDAADLEEYPPQAISNIVWSYATAGITHTPLFDRVAKNISDAAFQPATTGMGSTEQEEPVTGAHASTIPVAGTSTQAGPGEKRQQATLPPTAPLWRYKPQEVVNLAWAFATAQVQGADMYACVSHYCIHRIEELGPTDLANVTWAFAKAKHPSPALLDAVSQSALLCLDKFKPQELSQLLWGLASMQYRAEMLFQAASLHILSNVSVYDPHAVANMMWSFAKVNVRARRMVEALVEHSLPLLPDFDPQGVADVTWACARMRRDIKSSPVLPRLLVAVERSALPRLRYYRPQDLANLLWGLDRLGPLSPRLVTNVAYAAEQKIDTFPAWALAEVVGILDRHMAEADLFPAAAAEVRRRPYKFTSEELGSMQRVFERHDLDVAFLNALRQRRHRRSRSSPSNVPV